MCLYYDISLFFDQNLKFYHLQCTYRCWKIIETFTYWVISQKVHVTALKKVNLNEKKENQELLLHTCMFKKWEDNKIDRVKSIIKSQKTLSDDMHYTYNLEMILMRTWRKSWELEKWQSRSPLGENDWSVRGPRLPILCECGGHAEPDTWHHTQCPPVCKTAEKILYCDGLRNIIQKYVPLRESTRFQLPKSKPIYFPQA